MKKTEGLVAAPATAFLANGNIDLGCVAPMAEHLKRQGVVGVFVNGTTGEGMSLSTEEREQLAAEWRKVLPDGIRLFIHVGHNSIEESKRLASHAQAIGADAIAGMAPGFFKPLGVQGLVSWCAPVAAAAPDLPFYFYHMPSMSGVNVCVSDFLSKAAEEIPTLAGIKFPFEAMSDYMEALRLDNCRFDVLWGRDEMLLGALAMGSKGGVGSTFNIISPIYLKLIDAFKRGDLKTARDLQAQAIAVINVLVSSGNFFSALKSVLRMQGVPISLATRNPLVPLTQGQADTVCQRVKAIMPNI